MISHTTGKILGLRHQVGSLLKKLGGGPLVEAETGAVARQILEQAADLMAQAKACHDELETYYRAAVDFDRVDAAAVQCAEMLGLG